MTESREIQEEQAFLDRAHASLEIMRNDARAVSMVSSTRGVEGPFSREPSETSLSDPASLASSTLTSETRP